MKHTLLFTAFTFLFFQFALAQNISLDTAFGVGGKVQDANSYLISSMVQQNDGKTVCYSFDINSTNVVIERYNTNGSLDTTYGTNGKVSTSLAIYTYTYQSIAIQADGKIIAVGYLPSTTSTTDYENFGVLRLNTNGAIDTTFGTNGYVNIDFASNGNDVAYCVNVLQNGKIVVGGSTKPSSTQFDLAVLQLNSDGSIDTTFGINGKFTYNIGYRSSPTTTQSADVIKSMAINSFGEIILGGITDANTTIDNENFFVATLTASGTLKNNFATNGIKIIDFGTGGSNFSKIKVTDTNQIIASGSQEYLSGTDYLYKMILTKLNYDGTFDTSFASNGSSLINTNSNIDAINDFIILSNGKILCSGYSRNSTTSLLDFLVVQFNSNGTIDTTFNSSGFILTDFTNLTDKSLAIILQSDGKILVAGGEDTNGSENYIGELARYTLAPLSTNNFDLKNTITISPNPFTDSITISTKDINLSLATIELYDISGRKISNFTTENTNNFTFSINSNLSKGNYFLKIMDQQSIQTFKLVKE